ncbi:hypothetical protein H6P81_019924 [Aristolochia fimbriata]|uniref:U1-type domain-containing protein n=1 Tax=Aristolochia fimbriata TaxID=158543 RepID=A0AAV7DTA4_ARIFI|nr:hypothetical protein H6P81_019924 [Aristolochia fimbriata]
MGSEIPQQCQVQDASTPVPHFYNAQLPYSNYHYYNPGEPSQFSSRIIHSAGAEASLHPPGVDSFSLPNSAVGFDGVSFVYSGQHQVTLPPDPGPAVAAVAAVAGAYYYDSAAQDSGVQEVIRVYGADPYACASTAQTINESEPRVASNSNATYVDNSTCQPSAYPYTNIKKWPKKTKIVQSAWCGICKIDCNSKEVLDQHKTGKKHRKNLEKIEQATTVSHVSVTKNPKASTSANKSHSQVTVRREAPPLEPVDNLETKKRKLMQGGVAPAAVRVCEVCNVACNSETVYKFHLAGQKHATQLRKRAAAGPAFVGI